MKQAVAFSLVFGAALIAGQAQAQIPAPPAQPQTQLARGKQVYDYWCATCHGAGVGSRGAAGLPGAIALAAKYKGEKPALLDERTDLTPDQVRFFVRNGISIMPPFRKVEVSDADLDAIGAYIARNAKK